MHSEKYGFLTTDLTDIGTAMTAQITLSLPKLGRELGQLTQLAKEYHVSISRQRAVNKSDDGWAFIIRNKSKLGHSEKQLIEALWFGVKAMIRKELELEGKDISALPEVKPASWINKMQED